jgi:hypothetical protein
MANGVATIGKWRRHHWQMAPPSVANGAVTIGKWRRHPWQMKWRPGVTFSKKMSFFNFSS